MKGFSVAGMLMRAWMLVVTMIVVAAAGFAVYRLNGAFGARHGTPAYSGISNDIIPFNPKKMILEIFAASDSLATINYLDVDAQPREVVNAKLPWSYTITTTKPAIVGSVVAQGNTDFIGCRITVNGVIKDERTVHTVNAYTYCLDKSG
jgi:hypothetical protein